VGSISRFQIQQWNLTFFIFHNMKFFKTPIFFIIVLFAALYLQPTNAYAAGDFMRETGKINVVVGVILLLFFGIVAYLIRLERKLTKLEHQINEDHEWKN